MAFKTGDAAPWDLDQLLNNGRMTDAIGRATLAGIEIDCPLDDIPWFDRDDFFLPADYAVKLIASGSDAADHAVPNYSAEQIFDRWSTARTAPQLTYWIDPANGNDSTGDGSTEAKAWRSITKAIQAANSAQKTVKIKYRATGSSDAGDPIKGFNFVGGSVGALNDLTVDCCFEFYNGASVLGVHNSFTAALHSGATGTYAITVANPTDNVLDITDVDEYGIPRAMTYVPFVASGDIPNGCWSTSGNTTIIRRRDNTPVTSALCRIMDVSPNVRTTNNISLGFFPATPSDTLRIYGGGNVNGTFDMTVPASQTNATVRAVCAKNVTAVNYSYIGSGAGRCWSIDGLHGIAYLENCGAANARSDLYNVHNSRGSSVPGVRTRFVTVNCVGYNAGMDVRPSGVSNTISNNGNTFHDDTRGLDFGGDYRNASGGCVRNIGSSMTAYFGTVAHDRGDRWLGSTTPSTAFRSQDTAVMYLFRTKVLGTGVGVSIAYHNSGGSILLRDCPPNKGQTIGDVGSWKR